MSRSLSSQEEHSTHRYNARSGSLNHDGAGRRQTIHLSMNNILCLKQKGNVSRDALDKCEEHKRKQCQQGSQHREGLDGTRGIRRRARCNQVNQLHDRTTSGRSVLAISWPRAAPLGKSTVWMFVYSVLFRRYICSVAESVNTCDVTLPNCVKLYRRLPLTPTGAGPWMCSSVGRD